MMHGDGDSWHLGFGHWALGILFWVIVFVLIAVLAKYISDSRK